MLTVDIIRLRKALESASSGCSFDKKSIFYLPILLMVEEEPKFMMPKDFFFQFSYFSATWTFKLECI